MHKNKSKHKKNHSFQQQQANYLRNWNPLQSKQEYDALKDPHANYYFYNKSVNHHLKSLNRALKTEKNQKQKQKLRALIKPKIKLELPVIEKTSKVAIYFQDIKQRQSHEQTYVRKGSHNQLRTKKSKKRYHKHGSLLDINNSQVAENNDNKTPSNQSLVQSSNIKLKTQDSPKKQQQSEKRSKVTTGRRNHKNIEKVHESNHKLFLQFLAEKKNLLANKNNRQTQTSQKIQ